MVAGWACEVTLIIKLKKLPLIFYPCMFILFNLFYCEIKLSVLCL